MPTPVTHLIVTDAQRLWTAEDIAHYIRTSNASAVLALPGFPKPLILKGVRGPRWSPRRVIEFLDTYDQAPSEDPTESGDMKKRCSIQPISVKRIDEIVGVA